MSRVYSLLQVAQPSLWDELSALMPLEEVTLQVVDDTTRKVSPSFEAHLDALTKAGIEVLLRSARRTRAQIEAHRHELEDQIAALPRSTQHVLFSAQRHALDGVVAGLHAWDPEHDREAIRQLVGGALLFPYPNDPSPPGSGRYRLNEDLPPPPEVAYDFEEAAMDETDDLSEASAGPVALLHDLASLAAALHRVTPRRTHAGTLTKADAKKLGRQLGAHDLAKDGQFHTHDRWTRALQALEVLGAVSMDPIQRELYLDLGLERTLEGETPEAIDRFVHKLLDRDLHVVLPAIREALRVAGTGAVDEMIFLELLYEQHRDVFFPRWRRDGAELYPIVTGERAHPYTEEAWERIETRLVETVLRRLERVGMVRRADGVFAGTDDGRLWAGAVDRPVPPVWVSSDLELVVPPESVTPWERFQLERLGHCLARDTVDRYKLERPAVAHWLRTHDLEEAMELLKRRSPGIPPTVRDTLFAWAESATRVVLTRGLRDP